jgi:NADH:ubiquinone oxidoreductase subunit F (NADH-binding)
MSTTLTYGAPVSSPTPAAGRPGPAGLPRLLAPGPDLAGHLAALGPLPPVGPELVREIAQAGLTGRGGAGFPTHRKLEAVASHRGPRVVVANGTEGEPLSAKDKTLLTHVPHLVLDGLDAAARAVRANRRILCLERGQPAVYGAVRQALAERRDDGVEVVLTPHRYVTGQEAALVDFIDGGPGRPTLNRPFERGVAGRPTLVDNVETLGHLALIARFGPAWYRQVGTADSPGSALVTMGGAVSRPGVYEIGLGTSLEDVLGLARAGQPRAILLGGYFGRWLPGAARNSLTLDAASLARHGAGLGCGVIAVIDDDSCAVAEMARVAGWYAQSSAGQCGACTWGLRDLAAATSAIDAGSPDPRAVSDVRRWTTMIKGRGACRLPDGAAAFLESGIQVFAEEIAEHQAGRCRRPDRHLLPTPTPEAWR